MATTAYREHQYLNHFECSTCEGNGETATHARCPGCHGTGLQTCLLTAGCEAPADVMSAHDEGTPACQACEDAAAEQEKVSVAGCPVTCLRSCCCDGSPRAMAYRGTVTQ